MKTPPLPRALPCPHCGGRLSTHHLRDTGQLAPAVAVQLGYCPALTAKRNTNAKTLVLA